MDIITHIALGACIGEIVFAKQLGKKALIIGAFAQVLPDMDIVAALWLPPPQNLLFHRGITHSFLFGILAALILAFFIKKRTAFQNVTLQKLLIFFLLQIWLHDLLDTCNAYGTGLLAPFSSHRFSINLLFVADPFFTVPIIIACTALIRLKSFSKARKKWLWIGLLIPCLYILYAAFNKKSVSKQVEKSLATENISYSRMIITPTFFNTWLWYIVAATDSGYYIGYRSVFDSRYYITPFNYYAKNKQLLISLDTLQNVRRLIQFADNYYTVEDRNDSLVFNVLRFGQAAGWEENKTHFTFQYFLNPLYNNSYVMQSGRFKEWTPKTFESMYNRIKGR